MQYIGDTSAITICDMERTRKGKGRGVILCRDVPAAGTPVYSARPDIAVLYTPFGSSHCFHCFQPVRSSLSSSPSSGEFHDGNEDDTAEEKNKWTPHKEEGGGLFDASPHTRSSHKGGHHAAGIYRCTDCDQFVLCPSCVSLLTSEVRTHGPFATPLLWGKGRKAQDEENDNNHEEKEEGRRKKGVNSSSSSSSSFPASSPSSSHHAVWSLLAQHKLLVTHKICCGWYNELPASVRAKGLDTDYLRFCLLYGAMRALEEYSPNNNNNNNNNSTNNNSNSAPTRSVTAGKKDEEEEEDRKRNWDHILLSTPTSIRDRLYFLCDNRDSQSQDAIDFCVSFARDKIVATFGPQSKPQTRQQQQKEGGGGVMVVPRYPCSADELAGVLLRVRCNSLGFPFTEEETIGWSLEHIVCMINHSCEPNCAIVPALQDGALLSLPCTPDVAATAEPGLGLGLSMGSPTSFSSGGGGAAAAAAGCFVVKALRPMKCGEEITISYVDVLTYGEEVDARTRALLETYRFFCDCPKCVHQRRSRLFTKTKQ